jgi:hypothetical protein
MLLAISKTHFRDSSNEIKVLVLTHYHHRPRYSVENNGLKKLLSRWILWDYTCELPAYICLESIIVNITRF